MSNACSPVHVCLTFSFMQVPLALNGRHKTFPHSFRWPLALALALPFLTSAFLSTPQSFSTGCVNVDCGATYDDDPCFELSVSFCVHSTICALLGVSPRDRRLCVLPGWQMRARVSRVSRVCPGSPRCLFAGMANERERERFTAQP